MKAKTAVGFLNAGLEREEIALRAKAKLIAKLAKRLETDPSQIEIIEFAHQVLDTEEQAYRWLSSEHPLLGGKPPIEVMLSNGGSQVMRLLINIEHGLPV